MEAGEQTHLAWALRPRVTNADVIPLTHEFTVGRERKCDLVLSEPHVSRRHATFLIKDDKLYLQDTGSANGTFVNDHRIQVTVLKAGDVVRFEATEYEVVVQQRDAAQVKPAAAGPESASASESKPQAAASNVQTPPADEDKSAPADRDDGIVIVNRSVPLAESAPLVSLVVSGGAVAGQQFRLGEGVNRIGRDSTCDIVLNARAVSSLHAEIECVDGQWQLRDCDSSNGTQHNGIRVSSAQLADGDQLIFGDVELIFTIKDAQ